PEMLSIEDEQSIARAIVKARNRIRRLLRRFPRLVAAALPLHGRSVIHPSEDFRERETVMVLDFAKQQLRSRRRLDLRFGDRVRMKEFVHQLEHDLAEYRELRD